MDFMEYQYGDNTSCPDLDKHVAAAIMRTALRRSMSCPSPSCLNIVDAQDRSTLFKIAVSKEVSPDRVRVTPFKAVVVYRPGLKNPEVARDPTQTSQADLLRKTVHHYGEITNEGVVVLFTLDIAGTKPSILSAMLARDVERRIWILCVYNPQAAHAWVHKSGESVLDQNVVAKYTDPQVIDLLTWD